MTEKISAMWYSPETPLTGINVTSYKQWLNMFCYYSHLYKVRTSGHYE